MSRRPAAGADRAAQNAQTLKALVKLDGNKVCGDCKRNKHPRWASWNLGVFVCIRCSGIHRGMGTHISRVKSVDLDAWTDEQLQSILKWGNTRANKYWEAKLAPGHVPSEAKIENFIRTKYESKRWVMDGPMPDPATLDAEGDDDLPLNIVQEKARIERSSSQRQAASQSSGPPPRPSATMNLFDDDLDPSPPPVRPNTADIPAAKATRTGPPAPQPASKPQNSLMGLDFFGSTPAATSARPASAASNPVPPSNARGDLKNSILSLYASAPKPPPAQPAPDSSFGALTSAAPAAAPKPDGFGGLADAFGGMSFSSTNHTTSPPIQPASAFPSFSTTHRPGAPNSAVAAAPPTASPPPLSGGSFFDPLPTKAAAVKPTVTSPSASNGLDFSFTQRPAAPAAASQPARTANPPKSAAAASIPADLFAADDFGSFASSGPASPPKPTPSTAAPHSPTTSFGSAFNLSSNSAATAKPAASATKQPSMPSSGAAMFDPWGSNHDSSPWGAPEPAPAAPPAAPKVDLGRPPAHLTPNDISGGWAEPISSGTGRVAAQPTVTADEDFGGWTSASTTQTPVAPAPPKSSTGGGAFGGASDPFDNPWG